MLNIIFNCIRMLARARDKITKRLLSILVVRFPDGSQSRLFDDEFRLITACKLNEERNLTCHCKLIYILAGHYADIVDCIC